MGEAKNLLDKQLSDLGRVVLKGGGSVSRSDADDAAHREYDAFSAQRKLERQLEAAANIAKLKREAEAAGRKR